VESPQRRRGPPVRRPGQTHEGRHEQAPDDRGVQHHGQRQADAEQLEERHVGGAERQECDGQQGGGGAHDPPGPLEPERHGCCVPAGAVVLLLDAGQEEHLVVHRQAEGDAEHEDRHRRVDAAGGREVEQAGEVAVLEDPDHRAERGGQAEQVEDQRLDRDQHASGHQEQQHQGGHGDDGQRPRQAGQEGVLGVDQLGGAAADQRVETGVESADVRHELLAGTGLEIDARHDLEQGRSVVRVPGRARRGLLHHVAVLIDPAGALDAGDAVDRRHVGRVGGQRDRVVGPLHHDRERLGAVALEVGVDPLGDLPGVGRLRQDPLVGQADRET
jgi:hypothetical protein